MKKFALVALALLVAGSAALASNLTQFKAGQVSFSVLDKDGVTPLQSASIKAISADSKDVVAEVVSDELGQAVLALEAGRYLLNISDIDLAIFDVSAVDGIAACRVIMPDRSLLVGGKEAAADDASEEDSRSVAASWFWPAVGGVAAVAVLVGAGFIIDNNTKGHSHSGNDTPVPPPAPRKSSHKTAPASAK